MAFLTPYFGWTEFTPALPSFYWDVYSMEQRIKHICYELHKLCKYSNYLALMLNDALDDVQEEIENLKDYVDQTCNALRRDLVHMVEQLQMGFLEWDVQLGRYETTVEAQRDMFNDVTVHAYNNEQLETIFDDMNFTVDDLAECGLNVKGYAIFNHYLQPTNQPTSDLMYHA